MIWIFGDSFSVCREDLHTAVDHELWSEQLGINLNQNITYCSQWGSANEWIINKLVESQTEFNSGDKVIIQLTSPERQWFFKDDPTLGNFYVTDLHRSRSKQEVKAVEYYIKYLDNNNLNSIRNNLYHLAIKQITQILRHVHILVLPGWLAFDGVNGVLMDICNGEFKDEGAYKKWYTKNKIDTRANHISKQNHKILADKITDYFENGSPIDLKTGFMKGFLE